MNTAEKHRLHGQYVRWSDRRSYKLTVYVIVIAVTSPRNVARTQLPVRCCAVAHVTFPWPPTLPRRWPPIWPSTGRTKPVLTAFFNQHRARLSRGGVAWVIRKYQTGRPWVGERPQRHAQDALTTVGAVG